MGLITPAESGRKSKNLCILTKVRGIVNGIEMNCILDSKVETSSISPNMIKRNTIKCKKEQAAMKQADGSLVYIKFTEPLSVVVNGKKGILSLAVMPSQDCDARFGLDFLEIGDHAPQVFDYLWDSADCVSAEPVAKQINDDFLLAKKLETERDEQSCDAIITNMQDLKITPPQRKL